MQNIEPEFGENLLRRDSHLSAPVTAVFVRVAVLVVLVDPAEVSAIVLSIIDKFANLEVRIRHKPLNCLRMEDHRGGVLRSLVGGVDDELGSLGRASRGDIRSNFGVTTRTVIVETLRERAAMEDESTVSLLGQERGAVSTKQIVDAITPANVLTDIFVEFDQVFNRGAFGKHVEHRRAVIGHRITVITSVVLVEAVIEFAKDTNRKDGGRIRQRTKRASRGLSEASLNGNFGNSLVVVVVVTLNPLLVDVVGKDLDVVVDIINRESRSANVFQADPIRLNRLMAERKGFLIEGIANFLDGSQAGVVLTSFASDANSFPAAASGNRALGDGVGDRFAHVVGESRLGDKTQIGVFVQTQAMSTKSDTSSLALEIIIDGLTSSSSLC